MPTTGKFQPGDVVRLKSGGPFMTVARYIKEGRVECVWFEADQKSGPHEKVLEEVTLEPKAK